MSKRASRSKSVRLSSQIMKAMGFVLFLFALVISFYFYIVTIIPEQGADKPQISIQNVQLASKMNTVLLDAQNNAHLFLQHKDIALADKHKAQVNELLTLARQFKDTALKQKNTEGETAGDQVIAQIQSYAKAFQELADATVSRGADNSSGLRGQLDTSGKKFNSIVSRNEAGNLALALIQVQIQQSGYLRAQRRKSQQNLISSIKNLESVTRESTIDPLEAQLLRKSIKQYNAALDRYQAVSLATTDPSLSSTLGKEQSRQADAMRSALGDIESIIYRVNVPNALNLAMSVRQHETDYLLYRDEQNIDQFDKALDGLINAFNSSSILQEHKNELVKASILYRDSFKTLVENDRSIVGLTDQFNNASATLATRISTATSKTAARPETGSSLPFAANMNQLALIAACSGLVVILIGLVVALMLGKSISAPVTSMTKILQRVVREKDFTIEIPATSKNEIGLLATELNNLLQLQQSVSGHVLETSGTLSPEMTELAEIATDINNNIQNITEVNSRIISSTSTHDELADQAHGAIKQITDAAGNLGNVTNEPGDQNEQINEVVEQVSQALESTLEGIQSITQSSSQISDIMNLSTDIAEQTNLLALNASVKAARAGSHGQEFSVIADEIAKLAKRSEEVAKEARQLTSDLTTKAEESVTFGDDSRKSLEQIQAAIQANDFSAQGLTDQTDAITPGTGALSEVIENLSGIISNIGSLASKQLTDCNEAQEAVSMLLEKTSTSEELEKGEEESSAPKHRIDSNEEETVDTDDPEGAPKEIA